MHPVRLFSLYVTLVLLTACCGGGGGPAQVTQPTVLAYVDPPATGWRWQRNGELSTPTRLVLDLLGPGAGLAGRGVVFGLQADPAAVVWVPPGDGEASLVQDLALSSARPLKRCLLEGGLLRAGLFRRGRRDALALDGGLARVALAPQAGLARGQVVPLKVVTAQILPASGTDLVPQPCAVGVLTTR